MRSICVEANLDLALNSFSHSYTTERNVERKARVCALSTSLQDVLALGARVHPAYLLELGVEDEVTDTKRRVYLITFPHPRRMASSPHSCIYTHAILAWASASSLTLLPSMLPQERTPQQARTTTLNAGG